MGKGTALWLIQNGLLPAINTMRKTDRYLINRTDIAHYLRNRELEPDEPQDDLRNTLLGIWANVPDVLRSHEVQALLGYKERVVTRWRNKLGLKYIKVSHTIYYPKTYLIDFILSPQSQAQYMRSAEHIHLMRRLKNAQE